MIISGKRIFALSAISSISALVTSDNGLAKAEISPKKNGMLQAIGLTTTPCTGTPMAVNGSTSAMPSPTLAICMAISDVLVSSMRGG